MWERQIPSLSLIIVTFTSEIRKGFETIYENATEIS